MMLAIVIPVGDTGGHPGHPLPVPPGGIGIPGFPTPPIYIPPGTWPPPGMPVPPIALPPPGSVIPPVFPTPPIHIPPGNAGSIENPIVLPPEIWPNPPAGNKPVVFMIWIPGVGWTAMAFKPGVAPTPPIAATPEPKKP